MKIGFISLGCPKNLVDSEVMLGLAREAGHELTRDPADADVLVVNTCAFIESAKQESIDAILDMARYRRDGRTRLVVTGCLAERYRDELRREIPEIDVVLGTDEVPDIVGALEGRAQAAPARLIPVASLRTSSGRRPTYIYDANTPRLLTTPRHYAYVKVAEGCDYKCSFCIIPALRGAYRSRPPESVLREARDLARQGVRELLLVSQDTTFFGVDRGDRGALAALLRDLGEVGGLEWIRLLYLYPTTITDSVLDAMAASEKVCKYIDLPLQHASAGVLKRMKRPGNGSSYRRLLDRIRRRVPGVTLRTTFIVGFPGETEAQFGELERFVREQEFDHVGVFTYSHEEGTTAYEMTDEVGRAVKAERQAKLMSLQRSIVTRRNRSRIGERTRVLVEGPSAEHPLVLKARTQGQAPEIDSVVYLSDCDPAALAAGSFVDVEIVDARGYDLVARPVGGSCVSG